MANILAFLKLKELYLLGPRAVSTRESGRVWRYSNPAERAREREITNLVEEKAGGRICVEFSEDDRPLYACIVEVPEENKDVLLEPPVAVVYTGPIPRVRKNDKELKLAARIWDSLREDYASKLQPAPTPAMDGE